MKEMVRLGKSRYGTKWHILREDGMPLCGYASFNWHNGREEKEVETPNVKELCKNCKVKWYSTNKHK